MIQISKKQSRRALLMWLGLIFMLASLQTKALADTLDGPFLKVVDQLNEQYAKGLIGVDPYVQSLMGTKTLRVRVADDDDWRTPLGNALKADGLTIISVKQRDNLMISHDAALALHNGIKLMGRGSFTDAEKYFEQARKNAPDNRQAIAMEQLAKSMGPSYSELRKQYQKLDRLLDKKKSKRDVYTQLNAYDEAMGAFFGAFTKRFLLAAEVSSTELQPVYILFNKQIQTYTRQLDRVRQLYPSPEVEKSVAGLKLLATTLQAGDDEVKANLGKALQLVKDADALETTDKERALALYSQAFDLHPSELRIRAMVAWLRAELRYGLYQQQSSRYATWRDVPDTADQNRTLEDIAADALEDHDRQLATVLLALLEQSYFGLEIPNAQRTQLSDLVSSTTTRGQVGVLEGLVTTGGQYSGGSLFPVSVRLGNRQDLSRYHEVVINDVSQAFDEHMMQSFEQALGWLDSHANDQLAHYRVMIQFKDMESAKGGDSMGAALGVCGYSALYELPIRPSLTMTGSIRAYGGIGPVGGIPAKLNAAISGGKKTIIIPQDNAQEVYLLPGDHLHKIRVLAAKKIEDYLVLSVEHSGLKEEADARYYSGIYRMAHVMLQLGRLREAKLLYTEVVRHVPHDLSAARTADLLQDVLLIPVEPPWLTAAKKKLRHIGKAKEPQKQVDLGRLGESVGLYAAYIYSRSDSEKALAGAFLAVAKVLAPDSDAVRLLQARLDRKMAVPIPDVTPDRGKLADQLVAYNTSISANPDRHLLGQLCLALVLDELNPNHEAALLAWQSTSKKATDLATDLERQKIANVVEGAGRKASEAASLALKPVNAIDLAALPKTGYVWGAQQDEE